MKNLPNVGSGASEFPTKVWLPLFVAAAIFVGIFAAFFPGLMSFDSLQQFRQVEGLLPLSNGHPAVMVYMWGLINSVLYGPAGLYLFHLFFFYLALTIFSFAIWDSLLPRVLTILFVGLNPAVTIHLVHLWKDASLEATAFMGVALLLSNERRSAWWKPAFALVFLGYALGVRLNAFPAILPLLVWASWRLASAWFDADSGKTLRVVCAGFLFVFVVGATHFVNSHNVKSVPSLGVVAVWDMVGVSVGVGKNLIPERYFLPVLTGEGAGTTISDANALPLLKDRYRPFLNYSSYEVVSPYAYSSTRELLGDWLSVVRQEPAAYLKHRLGIMKIMFAVGTGSVYYAYHPGIDQNEFGFVRNAEVDRRLFPKLDDLAKSWIMAGWLYLLTALICLCVLLARFIKRRGVWAMSGIGICCAGLLYWAPLPLIAPAADYRYLNLGILFTVLALVLLIKDYADASARASSTQDVRGA